MSDDPADLSKLQDIVVPAEVSWWPLAPGWIALATIAFLAICYYGYRWLTQWKKDAYRREALKQLAASDSTSAIAEILRRTALATTDRDEIAGLQGDAWTDWIGEKADIEVPASVRRSLTQSIYAQNPESDDLASLKNFATTWIRQHRNPC